MRWQGKEELRNSIPVPFNLSAEYDAPNEGVSIIGFELRLAPGEKAKWTAQFVPVR